MIGHWQLQPPQATWAARFSNGELFPIPLHICVIYDWGEHIAIIQPLHRNDVVITLSAQPTYHREHQLQITWGNSRLASCSNDPIIMHLFPTTHPRIYSLLWPLGFSSTCLLYCTHSLLWHPGYNISCYSCTHTTRPNGHRIRRPGKFEDNLWWYKIMMERFLMRQFMMAQFIMSQSMMREFMMLCSSDLIVETIDFATSEQHQTLGKFGENLWHNL